MSDGFTTDDAVRATTALREVLGKPPERFPVQAFVGMISDEIEGLRAAGKSDADISELLSQKAGVTVAPEDIGRYYASPDERGQGHG